MHNTGIAVKETCMHALAYAMAKLRCGKALIVHVLFCNGKAALIREATVRGLYPSQ